MRRGRKTNQITNVVKFLILGGRGMKRKFAVIMSAALAAGSTMPVMAESETAFTPSTYVGEFLLRRWRVYAFFCNCRAVCRGWR